MTVLEKNGKKYIRVKAYMHTGFAGATHKDEFEITEDDCDLEDPKEIEGYMENFMETWIQNQIECGWDIE